MCKNFKDNAHFTVAKTSKEKFSIVHTAKTVEYTITGFRMKNKSEMNADLVKGIMASANEDLHYIFLMLVGREVSYIEDQLEKIKKP
jgi:myosin heavy subunit